LKDCSPFTKTVEEEEGIRCKCTESSFNLAKLLLHSGLLKCTAGNKALKR
jgi:hypothetical protein